MTDETVVVYDDRGREYRIARAEWAERVLAPAISEAWSDPDRLYEVVTGALRDGLDAYVGSAAERLAGIDPDPERGPLVLAIVRMRAGRLDEALEEFSAAQKAMPEDPEVRLNYGVALAQKKNFPEAEKQLRRALKKMDRSAPGRLYLGMALIGLKDIDGAERELQQAARLGGAQMAVAHRYLGGIYWARKDYKRAADELETYLKLSPKAADAEQTKATIKDLRRKQ